MSQEMNTNLTPQPENSKEDQNFEVTQTNLDSVEVIPQEERLDDEKRVKVISPNMMVFKRFLRNQLAIVGLAILIVMFVFSFIGGVISPYGETEVFRKYEKIPKDYASATINNSLRYVIQDGESLPNNAIASFVLAMNNNLTTFTAGEKQYSYTEEGEDLFLIYEHGKLGEAIILGGRANFTPAPDVSLSDETITAIEKAVADKQQTVEIDGSTYHITRKGKINLITGTRPIALASKLILDAYESDAKAYLGSLTFIYNAEKAILDHQSMFEVDGTQYKIAATDQSAVIYQIDSSGKEKPFASVSNLIMRASSPDVFLTVDFKQTFTEAVMNGQKTFLADDANGVETEYTIRRGYESYTILADTVSQLIDTYAYPSSDHLLGTDANGMDVLTRLMYGGRISLMVGFIVVILELAIGVIVGGISGFFGGAIDTLIMRFVDLFNAIPFWPIVIITGAVMDTLEVKPTQRIFTLMAVLGILGWTGIARVVRGQILSLREQDFMIATEATGIPISRRIFRHLVPNVMPLLIVQATLALGGIIITEATLSFLGLGLKYPFASWGSIINAATNLHVMMNYWFIWIPAGILILLTVLGFNFVGDGLRDAFDPRMKR